MDRVRFGRALGLGARAAVKTLVTAVDAATAENPSARGGASRVNSYHAEPTTQTRPAGSAATVDSAAKKAAQVAAKAVTQTREVKRGLGRGSQRFGKAVWGPFVRLSGVVWLEVSGVFFGIFALLALGYMWKFRGAWRGGAADAGAHRSLMGAAVMLALFGYFCVSSFVRARRRERGR